jgi:hypothetical protein
MVPFEQMFIGIVLAFLLPGTVLLSSARQIVP